MRLETTSHLTLTNHPGNKAISRLKQAAKQSLILKNKHSLSKTMNTQNTSFTMNSSHNTPARELSLGWTAMPAFSLADEEVALGWDMMPALGQAMKGASDVEQVAQFLSATTRPAAQTQDRPSFWSMIGL